MPLVKEHYLSVIAARCPDLLPRYERAYTGVSAPAAYREQLAARLEALRRRHGFGDDTPVEEPSAPDVLGPSARDASARQLELPLVGLLR
jgi:hypothetical protein